MNTQEIGKVILRIVIGLTFFIHGLDKFQGGISNTAGFFESIGVPGFLASVVATIELLGGLALIVGLGTKIVGVLFSLIMVGAIFTAKLPLSFLGNGQMAGYELDLILLAASIFFVFTNQSKFSIDAKFVKSNEN